MPSIIEPESFPVDELPVVWSPVQWELSEEERGLEIEQQAIASLLWTANTPEAILRLLLDATEIVRAYDPPDGYDPDEQGEWDHDLITFEFTRGIRPVKIEREPNYLYIEYAVEDWGTWAIEIEPEAVSIWRL